MANRGDDDDNIPDAAFTGITASSGPGTGQFSSIMASISSAMNNFNDDDDDDVPNTATIVGTSNPNNTPPFRTSSSIITTSSLPDTAITRSSTATNVAGGAIATGSSTSTPTTLQTSTQLPALQASSTSRDQSNASGTASEAAINTTPGTLSRQSQCSGISCSAGLQAAVAIPVVLGFFAILGLAFFLARKKRRRDTEAVVASEKKKPKKRWSRHLHIFSFDTELLIGGRFSSTESLRSRNANSALGGASVRSTQPSVRSSDEVAPPYREAISPAHPPINQQRVVSHSRGLSIDRPSSTATAPPEYGSIVNTTMLAHNPIRETIPEAEPSATSSTTIPTIIPTIHRQSTVSSRDPFEDSSPISAIGDSPFNDPQDDNEGRSLRPPVSRNSSFLHPDNASAISTTGDSDAGSIHDAQTARKVSMISEGRTVENRSRRST